MLSDNSGSKKGYANARLYMEKRAQEIKEESIKKYLEENKHCLTCGTRISYEGRKNKFCSRSCSAKLNNNRYPKRTSARIIVCKCGGIKNYKAETCQECFSYDKFLVQQERTKASITSKGASRTKFAQIRFLAHKALRYEKREKCCKVCNFDVIVEVCHIKSIASFPNDALVKEINALDNLVYLCPNHHAMLDRGLITL
jgi:predicted nucleic acid-binding Zn ribbon protein